MTLTAFLLARIADDEDEANYALTYAVDGPGLDSKWRWAHFTKPSDREHGWSSSHHDGAPAPHRVLAECAAKRAIVHQQEAWDQEPTLLWVVQNLALPYAGHEDYQAEWDPRGRH